MFPKTFTEKKKVQFLKYTTSLKDLHYGLPLGVIYCFKSRLVGNNVYPDYVYKKLYSHLIYHRLIYTYVCFPS